MRDGIIVAFAGPQGAGKQRIAREIAARIPEAQIIKGVTTATKSLREGHRSISASEFVRQQSRQELLISNLTGGEWFGGNSYGLEKSSIGECLTTDSKIGLLILEEGALEPLQEFIRSLKRDPEKSLVLIFVVPPDKDVLAERLEHRDEAGVEVALRVEGIKVWEPYVTGFPAQMLYNKGPIEDTVRDAIQIITRRLPS